MIIVFIAFIESKFSFKEQNGKISITNVFYENMIDELNQLLEDFNAKLNAVDDLQQLDGLKTLFLGKKGGWLQKVKLIKESTNF